VRPGFAWRTNLGPERRHPQTLGTNEESEDSTRRGRRWKVPEKNCDLVNQRWRQGSRSNPMPSARGRQGSRTLRLQRFRAARAAWALSPSLDRHCMQAPRPKTAHNGRHTNSRVLPESNRSTTDCHFHCWRLSVVGGKEALRGLVVGLYTALHSTQDAVCPRMAGWVFGGSTGEPAWCFFWAASVSGSHSDLEWFSSCTCRH
jgi:hypothetical protein